MKSDPDYYDVWVSTLSGPRRDEFVALLLGYAGVDLGIDLARCLVTVSLHEPVGVLALADLLEQNHPKASRTLARLEELGLVARSPAADHRVKTASLTRAGRETVDAIDRGRRRLLDDAFRDWSDTDQATFARLSQRFSDRVAELIRRRSGAG